MSDSPPPEATENDENPGADVNTPPEPVEAPQPPEGSAEDADTFSREYVESLRAENARYRQRAQRADELAHRLHAELVRATNRLADPTDLDYSEEHLSDPGALRAAVDDLLTAKPHLRKPASPSGDVGQGRRGTAEPASLLSILKNIV